MKDPLMILLRNSGVDLSAYRAEDYTLDDGCYLFVRYVETLYSTDGFILEFISSAREDDHGCIEVTRHDGYLQYHCHGRTYDYLDIFDAKHAKTARYPKHLEVRAPTYS